MQGGLYRAHRRLDGESDAVGDGMGDADGDDDEAASVGARVGAAQARLIRWAPALDLFHQHTTLGGGKTHGAGELPQGTVVYPDLAFAATALLAGE